MVFRERRFNGFQNWLVGYGEEETIYLETVLHNFPVWWLFSLTVPTLWTTSYWRKWQCRWSHQSPMKCCVVSRPPACLTINREYAILSFVYPKMTQSQVLIHRMQEMWLRVHYHLNSEVSWQISGVQEFVSFLGVINVVIMNGKFIKLVTATEILIL